jgi:hypothetical protein
MYKLASVALTTVLGVAGIASAAPAKADPHVSVGIGLPGIVLYTPGYYAPYYAYGPYGRYWHRDYDRDRYEHRWDRDWGRRDHDGGRHWDRR